MAIKISRKVLRVLSILMLMTWLHLLWLYLLWQIFQRLKNYLTYRVASSLTLALFFVVSASAFNPQARSLDITPVVALLFLISASAFNPQVSRDYSTKISFIVVSLLVYSQSCAPHLPPPSTHRSTSAACPSTARSPPTSTARCASCS